jgi:YidC/Oxa1 family membrane protein insertase
MADGQNTLEVSFESAPVGGLKYTKTYVFHRGDYAIGVRHEVVNVSDQPRDAQLYMQLLRHGTVAAGTMFGTNTFTGPAAYTNEKKFHKLDFKDIAKGKIEPPPPANDGWIAMVQHYFASAWLLKGDPASEQLRREFRVKDLGDNLFTVAMVATLPKIAPGATQVVNSALFAGPEEEKKLEAIAPGLDLVKDYGIFAIISKPLYWLLNQLHGILGNWGWSIVALVVLLKAAFYWLNAKAYASMAKMKAINPKIMEMRERLKDKPQEMQQEMMRIYKTEKVNPMGGCFPIVIQIPVFIALYWVLLSSVEMRHAPWIGWITDLSRTGPLVHPAGRDDAHLAVPDLAQPDAARPDAGQADVDHAARVQRDVHLLPGRPGAVLDHEQRAVDRAAVVHQQAAGRAGQVSRTTTVTAKGRIRGPFPFC